MTREQGREQDAGGFTRDLLEEMLRQEYPHLSRAVESWQEEVRADFYDRLGRAYGAALDRAIMYGTEEERQARTRSAVRANMAANKTG